MTLSKTDRSRLLKASIVAILVIAVVTVLISTTRVAAADVEPLSPRKVQIRVEDLNTLQGIGDAKVQLYKVVGNQLIWEGYVDLGNASTPEITIDDNTEYRVRAWVPSTFYEEGGTIFNSGSGAVKLPITVRLRPDGGGVVISADKLGLILANAGSWAPFVGLVACATTLTTAIYVKRVKQAKKK